MHDLPLGDNKDLTVFLAEMLRSSMRSVYILLDSETNA